MGRNTPQGGKGRLGGDEGLEGQDLEEAKVCQEHGQQVQERGDDHADPVSDLGGYSAQLRSKTCS